MKNVKRALEKHIEDRLFQGKVVVLYGPRQVGKTTLVQKISQKYAPDARYLNCDEGDIQAALSEKKTSSELRKFLGEAKLITLDEAQRIPNIGLVLKLLVDTFPDQQILATGSSSFELSNKVVEPLTGRKYELFLPPFSLQELRSEEDTLERKRLLEHRMLYGMYPEVVRSSGAQVEENLKNISRSYLFKDILALQNIRHSETLEKLLQALALQIGSEVSYSELGSLVGIDKNTVLKYVHILEQSFIIFRLPPLSRNIRNELKKSRKIYFYDTGIRNALIRNFNPLHLRQDKGALFENFLMSERIKMQMGNLHDASRFFWRTHAQQEIDYIEEEGGKMRAFEIKWNAKKTVSPPKTFVDHYPDTSFSCITSENFEDFVLQ